MSHVAAPEGHRMIITRLIAFRIRSARRCRKTPAAWQRVCRASPPRCSVPASRLRLRCCEVLPRFPGVPHAAVLREFVLDLSSVPHSIFELDPGILQFDVGASMPCHKTGNDLTGWMLWQQRGLARHTTWLWGRLRPHPTQWRIAAAPAHTPCDPPPPPPHPIILRTAEDTN